MTSLGTVSHMYGHESGLDQNDWFCSVRWFIGTFTNTRFENTIPILLMYIRPHSSTHSAKLLSLTPSCHHNAAPRSKNHHGLLAT